MRYRVVLRNQHKGTHKGDLPEQLSAIGNKYNVTPGQNVIESEKYYTRNPHIKRPHVEDRHVINT